MVKKKIKKANGGGRPLTAEEKAKFIKALEKLDPKKLEGIKKKFGREMAQAFWRAHLRIITHKAIILLLEEVESLERRIEHIEQKLAEIPQFLHEGVGSKR